MRLLITGDRRWRDTYYLDKILNEIHALYGIDVVIEGCAPGVDELCGNHPGAKRGEYVVPAGWAHLKGIPGDHYPADWKLGKQAGYLRNETMLRMSHPDMVVAFHPDIAHAKGTKHMIKIAREAGLPVHIFSGY